MKTFMASPSTIDRKWYVVDAADMTLGRLASEVANFFILPSAFLRTIDAPANGVSGPFSRTIPDTLTCAIPTSAVKRNNVTHNRLLIELVIYEP